MSFDLRIHFVGLAVFVPEDTNYMHVLLPAANHVHEGAEVIEKHFARVIFDEAYLDPTKHQLSRKYRHIDIEGRELNLSGVPVADSNLDTRLPDELPALDPVAGPLDPALVSGVLDPHVLTGRVTVDSGAMTFCGLGAAFHFTDLITPQRMPVRTEWTVRGVTSRKSPADGGMAFLPEIPLVSSTLPAKSIPELFPIGQTIHLMVFYAIAKEFPPKGEDFDIPQPGPEERAEHFPAYYDLYPGMSTTRHIIPTPASSGIDVEVSGEFVDEDGEQTPGMTCLQAKATLGAPDRFVHDSAPKPDAPTTKRAVAPKRRLRSAGNRLV